MNWRLGGYFGGSEEEEKDAQSEERPQPLYMFPTALDTGMLLPSNPVWISSE
jgi:hypothetical protein